MSWESIQQFFRDNPRAWLVGAAAGIALVLAVWGFWGGFSLNFSQFFAAEPPAFVINNSGPIKHGERLSVSWSATNAQRCDAQGWFDTGGSTEGSAESDPVDACAASATNQVGINCTYPGGDKGTRVRSFSVDKSTCPSTKTPTPTPTAPGGGGAPVDPSGDCVFKTNFNAPEGAWFCKSLQCQLDGNPSGGQEFPPKGPASRLNISVYNRTTQTPDPARGPIFVRYILDSTPKCGSGGECYPPKDPLWTCTRPDGKEVDQGRNGHDFYDCYKPIVRIYDSVPVTCCANTGLAGDCYTIREGAPGTTPSTGPEPTSSEPPTVPTLTPTPVYPLLQCAPLEQTVALKQVATVTAVGGSGTYQWTLSGSGIQEGGTATSVAVSYTVAGQKVVRVSSGGQIATCAVTVTGTGGSTISPLSVVKRGINASTGAGGESSAITVNPNEIASFRISITNNGTTAVSGLRIVDTVPLGMTYRMGSTTIDGQVVSVDTITNGGLALDSMEPGFNMNVQWSAIANTTTQLAAGPHLSQPRVVVTGNDISEATADMTVTVYSAGGTTGGATGGTGSGTGGTGGAGGVETGPGDAVTIALALAAALTLLYSGYTRSSAFRRREADAVSRDQGPMNFKS